MPTVDVECTECAMVLPLEEDLLGTEMKCPKCKSMFIATKAGGAYEIVEPLRRSSTTRPDRDSPPASPPRAETDAERKIRERMEKWADE